MDLINKLHSEFENRYGVTFSDIDCDNLIDTFEQGGEIDWELCDAEMKDAIEMKERNR